MKKLVELLIKKNITISSCESYTGGLFAALLTSVPNASKVFKGSLVTYNNQSKKEQANVSPNTILKFGAISSETAAEMAINTANKLDTNIAVSFTGNAGPKALEKHPVGYVVMAIYFYGDTITFPLRFRSNLARNKIRQKSIDFIVKELKELIKEK